LNMIQVVSLQTMRARAFIIPSVGRAEEVLIDVVKKVLALGAITDGPTVQKTRSDTKGLKKSYTLVFF
jgi:hypothetical protein